MEKLYQIFLVGIGIYFMLTSGPATAEKINNVIGTFEGIYKTVGKRYNLDWRLLKAIAIIESSENPHGVNPNDPSYGIMQILYPQHLPAVTNWPPPGDKISVAGVGMVPQVLFNPEYNIDVGGQILSWNIGRYGLLKGIAVYNNWGARHNPDNGPFDNQGYVDKVLSIYHNLGGTDA